jgi:hypothetical protein
MQIKSNDCPFCAAATNGAIEIDANLWAVDCRGCQAIGPRASEASSAVDRWNHGSTLEVLENEMGEER